MGTADFLAPMVDQGSSRQEVVRPAESGQNQGDEGGGGSVFKVSLLDQERPARGGPRAAALPPAAPVSAPLWPAPLAAQGTRWRSAGQDGPRTGCPARRGQAPGRWLPAVRSGPPPPDSPGRTEPVKPASLATVARHRPVHAGLTEPARPYNSAAIGGPDRSGAPPAPAEIRPCHVHHADPQSENRSEHAAGPSTMRHQGWSARSARRRTTLPAKVRGGPARL